MITIGSNTSQNIVYDHPTISGHHLNITRDDTGNIILIDNNSKNGTKLNGRRIHKSILYKSDRLVLGDKEIDVTELFLKIEGVVDADKTDFSAEYKKMFEVFDEFQAEKDKINKKPLLPIIIKVGLTLCIIGVCLIYGIDKLGNYYLPLIMSIGVITMLVGSFSGSAKKKNEKLAHLRLKYEDQLHCPKCNVRLVNENLTYLKGKKRCINTKCDAKYENI